MVDHSRPGRSVTSPSWDVHASLRLRLGPGCHRRRPGRGSRRCGHVPGV